MKKILVLGAGKSTTDLIGYLLEKADQYDWHITVGDRDEALAQTKVGDHPRGKAIFFDVFDASLLQKNVANCDVVASVLPAQFHSMVAEECLKQGKHIVTPSYVSEKHAAMDAAFQKANLLFMGEIGLDPGIDHLTIMASLDELRAENAQIESVKSCCGALIAPESDTNPWHYKFTWAPMNVVKAGQGTALYREDGQLKYLPYNRLFKYYDAYNVDGEGTFEAYANRDSLSYLDKYGLEEVPTFVRCTLRKGGYCDAWNAFVQLDWTNDTYQIENANQLTYTDLLASFLPRAAHPNQDMRHQLANFLNISVDSETIQKMAWLGIFDHRPIRLEKASPAQILLDLLEEKWKLQPDDKDMVVMLHHFIYKLAGKKYSLTSSMVLHGEDAARTALSKTVGLPMAMFIKLLLTDKIDLRGVHIPNQKQVYEPILEELKEYGICFLEKKEILN